MKSMKTAHDLVVEAKTKINEVTVEQAQSACDKAAVIIDVREPAEFRAGHLANAVNIPRGLLEFTISNLDQVTGSDTDIVLYCKNSGRSALSAVALQALGFTQVTSIAGGFEAWHGAGMPIIEPQSDIDFD